VPEVILTVNGDRERLSVEATETLLDALRVRLGLTGTKLGCNQGVCGSCTVLIDGKPGRACLTLAAACRGRSIVTIEGSAAEGQLSLVQQAFVETGAVQCGYCTPGMILTAEALLRKKAKPSTGEIRDAIAGNLCRCSGYAKIVDAVRLAGERMPS
jgi:carbon-monoxide dehydrogenase small subunit